MNGFKNTAQSLTGDYAHLLHIVGSVSNKTWKMCSYHYFTEKIVTINYKMYGHSLSLSS